MSLKMVLILTTIVFAISCESSSSLTQEEDLKNLQELFSEIENLSQSKNCENAVEWKFTSYGSKACGGPQGYIAYSTKINEVSFLNLVENYTKKEADFNKKWSIISDCSLIAEPNSVECENGKPKFIY